MNNEFLKGVLDAKISRFLTESDYVTFANLSGSEQLAFFINNNLVTTNIVTNYEALNAYARHDLKVEISDYVGADSIYVHYFFADDHVKKVRGAVVDYYNEMYTKAVQQKNGWLVAFMDINHALLNVLTLLRAQTRGDSIESISHNYLEQAIINEEVYRFLTSADRQTIFGYLKTTFNIDVDSQATNSVVEHVLDNYLLTKLQELAIEGDIAPTLIYYIKMKQHELLRLRDIHYTKRI